MNPTTTRRIADQRGFTLVELLVVILIIGILGALALPSFLAQRTKAQDVAAKAAVVTARKALDTWETDHDSYAGAGTAELVAIEPSLNDARNLIVVTAALTFTASVDSISTDGGGTFTVNRLADGSITRTCVNAAQGGCKDDNTW